MLTDTAIREGSTVTPWKSKTHQLHDPAIPVLGNLPKQHKLNVQQGYSYPEVYCH